MSKFVEKLKQVSQDLPQPMGFRKAPPPEKSKILLVASLASDDLDNLADRVIGADAGLLRMSELASGVEAVGKAALSMPDIPWGGWLSNLATAKDGDTKFDGCDFLVFPATGTPLTLFQNDKIGKLLVVDISLSEGLLRAIAKLPVDGVLLADGSAPLTWRDLMLFQYFASTLSKPLLVTIPCGISRDELQAVWDTGVDGVVADVTSGAKLKELRRIVEKLNYPSPKPKRMTPLLPHVREEEVIAEAEEEADE